MTKAIKAFLTGLLLCSPLVAQEIKLPAEIKGMPGEFVVIKAETTDPTVRWFGIDSGLNLFPAHLLKDSKTAVVTALVSGRYRILAVSAKGDIPSEFAECLVVIGNPPPTPPPGPGPGPTPDPQPDPTPIPIGGIRVLMIYESDTPLPKNIYDAMFSPAVDEYLRVKCLMGPDGKTPEKRRFDDDPSLAGMSKAWQDLRAKLPANLPLPRPQEPVGPNNYPIPHVAIGYSSGVVVFSGPVPASEVEFLALLQKYGG